MHRLEITGETPESLYLNVVKTLSVFLRGAQPIAPVEAGDDAAPASVAGSEDIADEGSKPSAAGQSEPEIIPPEKTKHAARGSKNTEPKVLNDEIPDLTGAVAKELTLDGDIRPRLMAIQKACTARGMTMPECVAYIQKLYGPFGVAKAPQLKPEQFAEFMEASEAYLSGEA